MKKVIVLTAFLLIGFVCYAQSPEGNENGQGSEASLHGKDVSTLAKSTETTGRAKGKLISSAARSKGLIAANANASFNRGDAQPENASGQPTELPTVNGKPDILPPVTPPTTGQPVSTPVGKPVGVPIGVRPDRP